MRWTGYDEHGFYPENAKNIAGIRDQMSDVRCQMSGDREQRELPPAEAGAEKLGARGFSSFHGAKRP
ncbi:MAG: hypothetical protein LBI62_06425 [Candidatus Accumulibacter sp.]|jgi:hypothetical protein|nr:hypothetical protein [Accumulibacter sp.]